MTKEETTAPDPLIQLGRDLAYCRRRPAEVQTESTRFHGCTDPEDCSKLIWLENDEKRIDERIDVLEQMTTRLGAQSLRGVMVQIAIIERFVGVMESSVLDEKEQEAFCININKLLYSILGCLESETNLERKEVFGDDYLYRAGDPYRANLQAVAN